jgi:uncharacterized protein YodC (DUF2158 family)
VRRCLRSLYPRQVETDIPPAWRTALATVAGGRTFAWCKMAKTWKTGDKVKLAFGGPEMTVQKQSTWSGKELVHCQWFDKDGNLKGGKFDPDQLEAVS